MDNEETDVTTDSSTATDQTDTQTQNDQATQTQSNGSETDTNSDDGKDSKTVPYDRFHEVNEAKRLAEERTKELEAELEAARAAKEEPSNQDDVEIEEDTEKLLDAYVKKKGFVSQTDIQLRQDVSDLTTEYAKSGIPFNDKAIYDYAKKNDLPVPQSKAAWRALYRDLNHEAIVEAERKRAVSEYKDGNKSAAEKPGPGGAKVPAEPKLMTRKERIHAAAERIFGTA